MEVCSGTVRVNIKITICISPLLFFFKLFKPGTTVGAEAASWRSLEESAALKPLPGSARLFYAERDYPEGSMGRKKAWKANILRRVCSD